MRRFWYTWRIRLGRLNYDEPEYWRLSEWVAAGDCVIDVEGHELSVLRGMVGLLKRDAPILVVEDNGPESKDFLWGLGYSWHQIQGSPNLIFTPASGTRVPLEATPGEAVATGPVSEAATSPGC